MHHDKRYHVVKKHLAMSRAHSDGTLRAWDREPNATCPENSTLVMWRHQPTIRSLSGTLRAATIRLCTAVCTQSERCTAFVLTIHGEGWTCALKASCVLLVPAGQETTFFKPQAVWPKSTTPMQVAWKRPAALFITWYRRDLSWLRDLSRADVLDVVVYSKGGGEAKEVLRHTGALRYLKALPNFGITGGGREAHAMWQVDTAAMVDFL